MATILMSAVALLVFWASTLGPPHLGVWPLRAFALALALTTFGNLL